MVPLVFGILKIICRTHGRVPLVFHPSLSLSAVGRVLMTFLRGPNDLLSWDFFLETDRHNKHLPRESLPLRLRTRGRIE